MLIYDGDQSSGPIEPRQHTMIVMTTLCSTNIILSRSPTMGFPSVSVSKAGRGSSAEVSCNETFEISLSEVASEREEVTSSWLGSSGLRGSGA